MDADLTDSFRLWESHFIFRWDDPSHRTISIEVLLRTMLDDGQDRPMDVLHDGEINSGTEMMPIPSAPSASMMFDQSSTVEGNLRLVPCLESERMFLQCHRVQRLNPSAVLSLPWIHPSFSSIH